MGSFGSGVFKVDGAGRVVRFQTAVLWAALTAASAFGIRHYIEGLGKADDVHTAAIQAQATQLAAHESRIAVLEYAVQKGCK